MIGFYRTWPQKVAVVFVLLSCSIGISMINSTELVCEYYEDNCLDCNRTEICEESEDEEKKNHCYALWKNNSEGVVTVLMKGCWLNSKDCSGRAECVNNEPVDPDKPIFCCCDGEMCNQDYYWRPIPGTPPTRIQDIREDGPITFNPGSEVISTMMYSLVPIAAIALIVAVTFWMWRRHKLISHEPLPTHEPSPLPPPSPTLGCRPLQLLEIKARGRFGCVWKAQMNTQEFVAVKIFPLQDQKSWATETEFYKLAQFGDHENILHFIGAEKRGDNINMELWLITEFHEKGSLYDYLKGNLVTWSELCNIGMTMARGLAYLHEDIPATKIAGHKPAVAHRDFKSKNVLVKHDLTACVADFGLALKFEPGENLGDAHGQVGTRRYMAPEVLEGAINFNRDAFLRIDMYAVGLVLWELAARCSSVDGPVEEYMLPFEEEAGLHPTLEDMQDVVVQKKLRPQIKDHWYKHQGLHSLIETIEECWDQDSEARLSSRCVEERLCSLQKMASKTTSTVIDIPQVVTVTTNQPSPPRE